MPKQFSLWLVSLTIAATPAIVQAQDPVPSPGNRPDTIPAIKFLPYGVPVPVGTVLEAIPRPLDPKEQGRAVENTCRRQTWSGSLV